MEAIDVYKQLFTALQEGSIEKISKAAFKIMKMPVAITDASYVVVGLYPCEITGDAQWDSNHMHSPVIAEAILAFQNDAHWNVIQQAGAAILIDWGYCSGRPRYAAFIEKRGKVLGSIAFLIGDAPQEPWHLEAVNIIAQAVAIAMERDYSALTNTATLKGMLMKSLVMENVGSHSQFLQLAKVAGFMPYSEFLLAGVLQRSSANKMFSDYIGAELTKLFPNSLQMQQEDRFYLLMDGYNLEEKERVFCEIANKLKSADTISVALSYVFKNPLLLTQYKWQVDSLLDMSAQWHQNKTIFHYGDYVSDIAMRFIVKNMSSGNMLHPMIKQLETYDKEHMTDYLNTLKVYVQSMCSKNIASATLNIHRNTLFYRIEKIQDITGVDIRDIRATKTAYHLFLSFNFMDIAGRDGKR